MAILLPDNIHSKLEGPKKRFAVALLRNLPDDTHIAWYEPQFNLKGGGPTRPHFLLLDKGRGILVFEVVDRKVQRFSKGKVFVEAEGLQTGQVIDPIGRRAKPFVADLMKKFADDKELGGLVFLVDWVIVFPHLSRKEAFNRGLESYEGKHRTIFQDDLSPARSAEFPGLIESLLSNREYREIDDAQFERMRALMHPEGRIPAQGNLFSGEGDVIRSMDLKQEALARRLGDGHRLVRGVAGSGKTLILVSRAKMLAEHFKSTVILVTCYNRTLAAFLKKELAGFKNVRVLNLSRMEWRAIHDAGLEDPNLKPAQRSDYAEQATEALDRGAGDRFDVLLVDEAQDFNLEELAFLKGLLKPDKNDVLFVADAAQRIYTRGFSWREAGFDMRGRSTTLQVNYRNTQPILRFAFEFLTLEPESVDTEVRSLSTEDEELIIEPEMALREGPKPNVFLSKGNADVVDAVINTTVRWIKNDDNPRSVGLLYQKFMEELIQPIRVRLQEEGISYLLVGKFDGKDTRDKVAQTSAQVVLSTIQSSKGLEFPRVVLFGLRPVSDDLEKARRTLYVGMTRARDRLSVVVEPDNPFSTHFEVVAEEHGVLQPNSGGEIKDGGNDG